MNWPRLLCKSVRCVKGMVAFTLSVDNCAFTSCDKVMILICLMHEPKSKASTSALICHISRAGSKIIVTDSYLYTLHSDEPIRN